MVKLDLQNTTIRYGKTTVVSDLSTSLPANQVTALIGPNGTGKSSLLRAIAGLQKVEGQFMINDHPTTMDERRQIVAYMPQDTSASSSLSLLEVVLLGRVKNLGLSIPKATLAKAQNMLERFGLSRILHHPIDSISGGQRQLTFLAQALFRCPQVLLLDEPTAALDLRHQLLVLETVREISRNDGVSVMIAIHDLSLAAQFADSILCIANGKIEACGSPKDVLTAPRLNSIYGIEAEILMTAAGCPRITPLRAI